jgi:hypothetical protein
MLFFTVAGKAIPMSHLHYLIKNQCQNWQDLKKNSLRDPASKSNTFKNLKHENSAYKYKNYQTYIYINPPVTTWHIFYQQTSLHLRNI